MKSRKSREINPTNYDHIPSYVKGSGNELVHAVIETPGGIRHKYAFEPDFGIMELKQTLPDGLTWPYDYGFIPQTLADDGDPLDVLVISDVPSFSGCLLKVRVVGAIQLVKDDVENDRLVACPERRKGVSLKSDAFDDIEDVPKTLMHSLERFLVEYPTEEGDEVALKGKCSKRRAMELLEEARKTFKKRH